MSVATAKLEHNLAQLHLPGLQVVRCGSTAAAVQGADIVTTATADKRNATILTPEMIAPGVHLNAVGGDCPGKTELHPDILLRQDARVVVEYEPQSRIEGEIQQMNADYPVTELCPGARRQVPGRVSDRDVTIFDSVGFALEDFSSLRYLLRIHHEERWCASSRSSAAGSGRSEGSVRPAVARAANACGSARSAGVSAPRPATLIGAPTDVGAADRGASMGPEALRVAGLATALQQRELQVRISVTSTVREIPGSRRRRVPASAAGGALE